VVKRLIRGIAIVATVIATPALAASEAGVAAGAAMALTPNQFVWADTAAAATDPMLADPVSVIISIADQRAYVYRGERLVAASSVSTGKGGKDTPTGTYTILQKKEDHKSNLYNSAPMPFMQRLTWDGIAIHAGRNPGFPASHGCIRVPTAFAKRLFAATELGTTVTVVAEPVDPTGPPPPVIPSFETQEVARANMTIASSER